MQTPRPIRSLVVIATSVLVGVACNEKGARVNDTTPDSTTGGTDTATAETTTPTETSGETVAETVPETVAETAAETEVAETCGACGAHASCVDTTCVCDADAVSAGTTCVLGARVAAFRLEPATIHIGQPVTAVFDAHGAVGCTLASELLPTPLVFADTDLSAGHFGFSLTREQFATLPARGDGLVPFTLRCAGAAADSANVATASVYATLAQGPGIDVTASAPSVPPEGGTVDVCWNAPTATFCAVFGPETAVDGLGATGCVTDQHVPGGLVSDFSVQCGDGYGDGVGDIAQARVSVVSGAGMRSFDVNPTILGEPGMTHLTWEVIGVDACTVARGDEVLAHSATGVLDVAVSAQTKFTLHCTAGELSGTWTREVFVGAAILGFGMSDPSSNAIGWTAIADSCRLDLSNETFSAHFDDLPPEGKDAKLVLPIPTPTREDGLTITLTCTKGDSVATQTVTLPKKGRITSATFDPPAIPDGGGIVDFCWTSENADRCAIFLDGSGDEAGFYQADDCAQLEVVGNWMHVRLECWDTTAGDVFSPDAGVWENDIPNGNYATLTATPANLGVAGTAKLAWESRGLGTCVLLANDAFVSEVGASGTRDVQVAADTVFVLRCVDGQTIVDREATVAVGHGIVSFDVSPNHFGAGVAWATEVVAGCSMTVAQGDTSYVVSGLPPAQEAGPVGSSGPGPHPKPVNKGAPSGMMVPFDRSSDATLTLACTGAFGNYQQVATVPAAPPLAITSLTVTPTKLPPEGGQVDVCVTTDGAELCYLLLKSLETGMTRGIATPIGVAGFFTGNGCIADSMGPVFLNENTEVQVMCNGFDNSVTQTVQVLKGAAITAFSADPPWLGAAGSVAVSWQSMLATHCTLTHDGTQVATGLSGDAVAVAIDASTTLTLTCSDDDGGVSTKTLPITVGSELTVGAHATAPWQLVVSLAGQGLEHCAIVASNGTTTVGSGPDFGREDAPTQGDFYLEWSFADLGAAAITVTCAAPDGAPVVGTATVTAPLAPVIDSFDAPSGFAAATDADVCFSAHGMMGCALNIDGLGGFDFGAATHACWSDLAGAPAAFTQTTNVSLTCYTDLGIMATRSVVVPVGPSLLGFAVDQTVVAAGGEVNVTWSTYAMKNCTLFQNGDVLDTHTSGASAVTLDANTAFLLSCEGADGATYERDAKVLVGRQIVRFNATVADPATIVAEWQALDVDGCLIRAATAAGVERFVNAELPPEGGVGIYWDFATDGPADISLVCSSAGESDLSATQTVAAPSPIAVTSVTMSPAAATAPTEVDVCWSATGATTCVVEVQSRSPIPSEAHYDGFWGPRAGCASDTEGFDRLFAVATTSDVRVTCYGPMGMATETRILPIGPEITAFMADPIVLDAPGQTTVVWSTHAVTACTLMDASGKTISAGTSGEIGVAIDASTLLSLVCTSPAGDLTRHLGVAVGASAFIEDATAVAADQLLVAWRAARSDNCSLSLTDAAGTEWNRVDLAPTGRQAVYFPFAEHGDAELHLSCNGATPVEAHARVASPLPRIAAFSTTPTALATAGTAHLCWNVTQADTCALTVGDDVTSALSTEDCLDASVAVSTVATLACTGEFGTTTRTLPVAVGPTITTFTASQLHVPIGGYFSELHWESVLTENCTLSDGHKSVATGTSGAVRLFVTADTTFTLTCTAGAVTVNATLAVTVGPAIDAFSAVANPDGISVTLDWSSFYAQTCALELKDVVTDAVVFSESRFKSGVAIGLTLQFDFGLGHSARATLTCSDAAGRSDTQVRVIDPP